MNFPLRARWQERLDAAQTSSSWSARAEARVLRFLLSRYAGSSEATPPPEFPLYEGEPAPGRSRMLLSPRDQSKRLSHVKQSNLEREEIFDPQGGEIVDLLAWRDVRKRRKREAFLHFGQVPPPGWFFFGPIWWIFDVGQFLARILPPWMVKMALGFKLVGQILCSRR